MRRLRFTRETRRFWPTSWGTRTTDTAPIVWPKVSEVLHHVCGRKYCQFQNKLYWMKKKALLCSVNCYCNFIVHSSSHLLLFINSLSVCLSLSLSGPRWASWNLGVFICIRCAGIHRNLGVHISRVKSVNLDAWTPEQMEVCTLCNILWVRTVRRVLCGCVCVCLVYHVWQALSWTIIVVYFATCHISWKLKFYQ